MSSSGGARACAAPIARGHPSEDKTQKNTYGMCKQFGIALARPSETTRSTRRWTARCGRGTTARGGVVALCEQMMNTFEFMRRMTCLREGRVRLPERDDEFGATVDGATRS